MMRSTKALPLAALLFAGTSGAQFCPGVTPWTFNDVPASDPFCSYITWLAQKGVTLGCQVIDANNRLFCPADGVRRDQMAAFMFRLNDALFPSSCAAGQVMKWNGAAWTCSDDNIGGSGGGGTVTSVLAGTGLQASPNPIVGAGSINLAPAYQLPQSCANGQVPKSNGTGGWTCAADNDTNAGGTVTSVTAGTGLIASPNPITTTGTIAVNTTTMQRRVSGDCAVGSSIRAIAADGTVTCETDDTGPTNAFVQGGNAFSATAVLGTTDNRPLELRINGARVMSYVPDAISPYTIGGRASLVTLGARGATIAGGGSEVGGDPELGAGPNRVTDAYGTIGGGAGNRAGDGAGTVVDSRFATVGGGLVNTASGMSATVSGGQGNSAGGPFSVVGGGGTNLADSEQSAIGGGYLNQATGFASTVAGGNSNAASGYASTIAGGAGNAAAAQGSTVLGGWHNTASGMYSLAAGHTSEARGNYSIALGRRAKTYSGANNAVGAIVLADGNDFDFNISTDNRFAVRATGGVYLVLAIDAGGVATSTCVVTSSTGGWNCPSDRNVKHGLVALDGREVLDRLAAMPIYQWQPKGQNAHVRHYGPMAQDFHAAFGLGDDDKMIGTQDADGVALAAIKGLNEKLEAQIATQADELARVKAELAALRGLLRGVAPAR